MTLGELINAVDSLRDTLESMQVFPDDVKVKFFGERSDPHRISVEWSTPNGDFIISYPPAR